MLKFSILNNSQHVIFVTKNTCPNDKDKLLILILQDRFKGELNLEKIFLISLFLVVQCNIRANKI